MTSAAAEIVVVLATTSALAVMSHTRSAESFGAYAVSLRVLSLLQAPLLIGLGVTLPRILPRLSDRRDRSQELTSALCIVAVITALLVVVGLTTADAVATWLFGTTRFADLCLPLALLIGASLLHATVYAFLRGSMRFATGNVLTAVNLGIVPLVAAVVTSGVRPYLVTLAVCWTTTSLAVAAGEWVRPTRLLARMRGLVRVGVTRVPGEFALFGLTAVPPIAVSAVQGVTAAGRVSLAMSLLTLAGTSVAPFSAVLLPHVSQWIEIGDMTRLRATVRRALYVIALVFVPGTALGELLAPSVLPVAFGHVGQEAVPAVRTVLLAAPAYATFVMLRGVIDGATAKATTMSFAVVAFAAFCVTWPMLMAAGMAQQAAILTSSVLALWLLALLLLLSVRNLLRRLDPSVTS